MRIWLLLWALASAPYAQATLWVVDDDGGAGVDFADLQLAIDTASEGDGLLVREGEYVGNFVVDGKSLTIVAEPGARLRTIGDFLSLDAAALTVRNLAPMQGVTFLGGELLAGAPGFLLSDGGLLTENSEGVVWMENTTATTAYAVRAVDSEQVVLASCTGAAERGTAGFGFDRLPAGILEGAKAAFYDTYLAAESGLGGCVGGLSCGGSAGGAAASLSGASTLFASGGELHGGVGDPGGTSAECSPFKAGKGGDGGNGLEVDAPSAVTLLDNPFEAGLGGLAEINAVCPDGEDGEAVVGDGTVTQLRGAARSLACTTPVREAEPFDLTFRGEPDDFVFGLAAAKPLLLDLPGFIGPLAVNAPFLTVPIGTLPASGESTIGLTAGTLPPGIDFFARYLQALHVTPGLDFYLSAPTVLVVLDDAF